MDARLEQAHKLKQALVDFVLEAEGELAESLEAYTAAQSSRSQRYDMTQRDLLIDTFLTEGQVGDKTPLDLFLNQSDLSEGDRLLVSNWRQSFIGLFEVIQILSDGFELMNWLTAKQYIVKPNNPQTLEAMARFKLGEILLTRIAPVTKAVWMFSGPYTLMGKLGKPKLAVAIGNFKENYKSALYGDAPELLEQAWESVAQYHQNFLDFFGTSEVTMPGYLLNKKLAEFQEIVTQQHLAAAGIDDSKSLSEIVEEAGVEEAEMAEVAEEMGLDSKAVAQVFKNKAPAKMAMPKVELPTELKKAEQVTVLTHPRWGQMFLPTYCQFVAILEAEDWQSIKGSEKLIRNYLEDPAINAFIWHRLAQEYSTQLERVLQAALEQPDFKLKRDLDALLREFNKPLEPELPEIASVPMHLHNLFQEALKEVSKQKHKGKSKKKAAGFQQT